MGWRRLGLLSASVLLSLAAGELVLRLALPSHRFLDPRSDEWFAIELRVHSHQARAKGDERGNVEHDPDLGWRVRSSLRHPDETSNSRGLRGKREYSYERVEGVGRIVALGDSFTYGLGVGDEETWVARLEGLLPDHEVLNLGVNGYGTDQQLLYWEKEGRKYGPDLVVLGFYLPDLHRNANDIRELPKPRFVLEQGKLELRGVPVPTLESLKQSGLPEVPFHLMVFDLVGHVLRKAGLAESSPPFERKAELTEAILRRLRASCTEVGARLAVVSIPHRRQDYPDNRLVGEFLRRACGRMGVPLLELEVTLGTTREETAGERLYAEGHGHWTARGHAKAAGLVLAFLRGEGLLD